MGWIMKGLLIIGILVIIGIFFLVKYTIDTVNQGKELVQLEEKTEQIISDIEKVEQGDCSIISELEEDIEQTEQKFIEACKNTVLKKVIIQKAGEDICENPESSSVELRERLEQAKADCNSQDVTTS